MAYNSAYTGAQVDAAVGAVRNKETTWDSKQNALSGTEDQLVGFNASGEAAAVPMPSAVDVGADPAGTAEEEISEHNASSSAHAALFSEKQDKITGQQGQVVGFDEDGNAVPQAAPNTGVTSFDGRTGAVTPQSGDYTAEMVGARPSTWTPTASEVGAIPATEKGAASGVATLGTDGKLTAAQKPAYTASEVGARPSTWTPSAADVGAVPTSRTVNGKALSSNITLNASDVGARANNWTPTASEVGAVPTSRTVNGKALSSNITLTADDVDAASPPSSTTVTLTTSGWSSNTQTVTVPGVSADETAQLIMPVPALASQSAYYEAGILVTGQAANSLTFTCSTVPSSNLTVYVVMQEVQ